MFMKKNLKNLSNEIDDIFLADPTPNQKAWGLIHDFYHTVLICMEENGISKAELAKRMNISRSAISQTFNETPNISIKKMVEIADALEYDLNIGFVGKIHNIYEPTSVFTTSTTSFSEASASFPETSYGVGIGSAWPDDQSLYLTVNTGMLPGSMGGPVGAPLRLDA